MNIQTLRNDFPALQNYIWFQNGGVSMTPAPVAAEHARLMKELLDRGPCISYIPTKNIRADRRRWLGWPGSFRFRRMNWL